MLQNRTHATSPGSPGRICSKQPKHRRPPQQSCHRKTGQYQQPLKASSLQFGMGSDMPEQYRINCRPAVHQPGDALLHRENRWSTPYRQQQRTSPSPRATRIQQACPTKYAGVLTVRQGREDTKAQQQRQDFGKRHASQRDQLKHAFRQHGQQAHHQKFQRMPPPPPQALHTPLPPQANGQVRTNGYMFERYGHGKPLLSMGNDL